ncbi:mannitol dehydrogenase family protein [Nocardia blacklockiae]|uniref:mannitol dehydrogenase family protein n=1 Tax=Nocardia blacklockiae TaxID=480036 RepID=UPI001894E86E|nr:mannitol dehydrogenase family protein [Nocardia blacklockiae]MBF6171322.1 mannitol dehydrogenase family protein [Nocardia blacklockiae]
MKLNRSTVTRIPVVGPRYDRDAVRVGIAHFGVGGFHRAHQAMYLDKLMTSGRALEWGICGIGVTPADRRMRDVLRDQDGLYTLVLAHPDGSRESRVIGSIVDYRYAPDDPEAVVELLADPAIRIISLTITEGGYNLRDSDGEFDCDAPAVRRDLSGEYPPATVFGLVTAALARRRERGVAAPTIVSCDNIEGNGRVARRSFTSYAEQVDPTLAQWISGNVGFPNSMVDRITPVTTPDVVERLEADTGVHDEWPVLAEPFAAWVLEDDFAAGRPPLDDAGVQLVDDVYAYELMKLRLLNAGHQCLCYFAYLAGYRLVHEAAQDPLFAEFLDQYLDYEAMPTLPRIPGLTTFRASLIQRFANPHIRDTVARLCADSSDRIPKWLLPVIRDNLAADRPVRMAAATVAAWARYAEAVDEHGEPIEVVDRLADTLIPLARTQRDNPLAFLENRSVFGDLVDQPRFVEEYVGVLTALHRDGARATLEDLVKPQ